MISSAVILIISFFIALIMSGVLFIISRTYPKSIQGLTEWYWSVLLLTLALPLYLVRGHIPDFMSIVVANTLVLLCFMMMNLGTRKFSGTAPRYKHPVIALYIGVYLAWFLWFTYMVPSINMRAAGLSLFTLVVTMDQLMLAGKKLSRSPGRSMLMAALLGLIVTRIIRLMSMLLGYDQPASILDTTPSQLIFLAAPAVMIPLATVSYIMLASEKLNRELEFVTQHDDLTGCLNKKAVMCELEREAVRANRYQHALSTMVIDIDDFKKINDIHGHLAGDKVLIDFTHKAKETIRRIDLLGRFGGDEFVVVMPQISAQQAMLLAERLHEAVALSRPVSWTVSIGVSEWRGVGDTLDDLFARADQSLYASKQLGKNRSQVG